MQRYVVGLLLVLFACGREAEPASDAMRGNVVESPKALVEAMHAQYDDGWYETLAYAQETIQRRPDGSSDTSIWYEAYQAPGRLRIDFAPLTAGHGLLFTNDSQYVVRGGEVTDARPRIHPLLVLGYDVYRVPPEVTLRRLDTLGFDLTRMHEATWEGRPQYVVGAAEGDERAPQFWVDQERLTVTRMLRPIGPDRRILQETRFHNYERVDGGWIAPEVVFLIDGEEALLKRYSDVRAGMTFHEDLFDPARWEAAPHWYAPQ